MLQKDKECFDKFFSDLLGDCWTPRVPVGRSFVSVGGAKTGRFFERPGNDLYCRRQIAFGESTGDRNCRQTGEIERVGKIGPLVLFVGVHAIERFRRTGSPGNNEDIDSRKVYSDLLV